MRPEEPVFNGSGTAQQVIDSLLTHYDGIIRQLDGSSERYRPLYLPINPSQPATVERASEWSQGFWKAMMHHPGWRRLINDKDARYLLVPILAFAKDPKGKPLFGHTREQIEEILKVSADSIAECILLIKKYYQEYPRPRDEHGGSLRVGRNDSCPCSSGKKYKRCCGAD